MRGVVKISAMMVLDASVLLVTLGRGVRKVCCWPKAPESFTIWCQNMSLGIIPIFFPVWIGCIKYFKYLNTGLHQLVWAEDRNLLFDSLDEKMDFPPPPSPPPFPLFFGMQWHLPSLLHIYSSSFYKFAIYLQGYCWCKFIFLPSDLYVKSAGSREEGARG